MEPNDTYLSTHFILQNTQVEPHKADKDTSSLFVHFSSFPLMPHCTQTTASELTALSHT